METETDFFMRQEPCIKLRVEKKKLKKEFALYFKCAYSSIINAEESLLRVDSQK